MIALLMLEPDADVWLSIYAVGIGVVIGVGFLVGMVLYKRRKQNR